MTGPDVRNIKINVTVDSDTRGAREASVALDGTAKSADKAGDSMRHMGRDAKDLNTEIVESKKRIQELGAEYHRLGDKSIFGDLRKERSQLRELQRLAREASEVLTPAAKEAVRFPELDFSRALGESRGILIAGLVGIAVAAAPAIGAMVAGAVAGVTAGGGIAGGVIAAAHDPRVKQAWGDFMSQLTAQSFGSAEMAGPVIASIETLKSTLSDIDLGATFAKGGPALKELTDGVAGFVTNLMPGFNAVMDDSEAIMSVFGDGLADTGDALSDMLTDIVSSKGTLEGLHYLFMLLNGTIRALGNTLEFLGNVFHDIVNRMAIFTGKMEDVVGWVARIGSLGLSDGGPIQHVFAWMNDAMERIRDTTPLMASGMNGLADASKGAGHAAAQSAEDFQKQSDALKQLNEQLYTAQGFMLSADEAADRLNKDMLELTKSVQEDGTSLDDHTEKGLHNREMLRGLIQDLRAQYDANIKAGMAEEEATRLYNEQAVALQKTAVQMGFNAAAVATLIGLYKQIPPRIDVDIMQHYYTTGTPVGEHSGQRFNETYQVTPNGFQEFAYGGMVEGPFGSPQMAIVHAGERVLTPAQQEWGSSSSQPINLTVQIGTQTLRRILIDEALGRGVPQSTISAAYP